jgi:hypothetical protein
MLETLTIGVPMDFQGLFPELRTDAAIGSELAVLESAGRRRDRGPAGGGGGHDCGRQESAHSGQAERRLTCLRASSLDCLPKRSTVIEPCGNAS